MILLCDAGGTHARFALSKDGKTMSEPQKIKIAEFTDFDSIVMHYLASQNIKASEIVELRLSLGDRNKWGINENEVRKTLPQAVYKKLNDFEANAQGVARTSNDNFMFLTPAKETSSKGSSKLVVGVGTGLGHAFIIETPEGTYIQRSHGGHMIPATTSEEQRQIFLDLQKFKKDGTVTIYEDLISGPGLWHMYQLSCEKAHTHTEYFDTNNMLEKGRNDPLVQQGLKLFHEMLGLYCHQAVLFGFAFAGVYLTGGIIDRLIGHNLWDQKTFDLGFKQKNVPIVVADFDSTPIFWIKDEYIALEGLLKL
ncbi:MAG: glucokinase [Alphaproteobacteria bacterium]|nr:glucokinase [Alphaproteobacteria bacterium]